jgi:hypothetical protein
MFFNRRKKIFLLTVSAVALLIGVSLWVARPEEKILAQTPYSVYVEAESGTVTSPMFTVLDPNASNGVYVRAAASDPARFQFCPPDYPDSVSSQGRVTLNFNVPTAGNYYMWARVYSQSGGPDPSHADSLFLSVDGGPRDVYDVAENQWTPARWMWTRVSGRNNTTCGGGGLPSTQVLNPKVFSLTSGAHSISFSARENYTRIDKLFITSDSSEVPTDALSGVELYGWAWGVNTGWISFNSKDCDTDGDGVSDGPGNCPTSGTAVQKYQVTLTANNELIGYGWSSSLGWIKFGGLSGFPSGPGTTALNATYTPGSKTFSGWGRFCNPGIVNISNCTSTLTSVTFSEVGRADVTIPAGNPISIQTAQLNDDSYDDVIVTDGTLGVRVFLSNGSGTYSASTLYDVHDGADVSTSQVIAAAVGTVDGDNSKDIAVAYRTGTAAAPVTRIAFLTNNGSGSFTRGTDYTLPVEVRARDLSFASIDATRQKDDLVLLGSAADTFIRLYVYTNNGTGTFTPYNQAGTSFGGYPSNPNDYIPLVTNDLDKNGKDDVIFGLPGNTAFTIYLNIPSSGFASPYGYPLGGVPLADKTLLDLSIGDVDGNALSDVVVLTQKISDGSGGLTIFKNNSGDGVLSISPVQPLTFNTGKSVKVLNLNQDDLADPVVLNSGPIWGGVTPLVSTASGIVEKERSVAPTATTIALGSGDSNNDGRIDLLSLNANNTFSVYRNTPIAPAWGGWISMKGTGYGVRVNTASELEGYAWGGDGAGWISFNCNEGGVAGTDVCGSSRYRVTLFGPFNYDMNDTPDVSVPIGGTVTIPVTARYRTTVGNTSDITIIPQNLGTGLVVDTSAGLPVCHPVTNGVDPDYTVCSGNLVLRANAGATVGDHLISLSGTCV